ncbi:MAG: FAD-dependent oxidoreductase [Chloroflexi bacterium]|nr:MAG: FAD-dependent oxidoreductase [Chloroflexota bacterium]
MAQKYTFEGKTLVAERAEVPVFWQGDVIVAGGGPSGLGAAIAARRSGAKTLLIERHAFLGGMAAFGSGMPLGGAYPAGRSIGGIAEEILTRVRNAGPESADVREIPHFGRWYYHDSEYFKSLAGEIIAEEDVDVLLHTTVADVVMDGPTVRGLIIQNKSGRQAVLAKAFVDCTGDADVAASAGAEYIKGRPEDGAMMAVTLPYIMFGVDVKTVMAYREEDPAFERARARAAADGLEISPTDRFQACAPGMRPDHFFSNIIRIRDVDGTDAVSLTNAEFEARKRIRQHIAFFRKYVPGCENSYVGHTSEQMGIRDTRRIIGEARLETEACLKCTKPKDTILRCMGPIDNVDRGEGSEFIWLDDEGDWYGIPYGCMVPKGLDNLLVAGRSFSSSERAQAGSRGQALLMGMGHAAGAAAVLVAERGIRAREVDVPELQTILTKQGMDLGLDELED